MGASNSSNHENHKPRVVWKWEAFPGIFVAYSNHKSLMIEKHFLSGSREVLEIKAEHWENPYNYQIDFHEMTQTNIVTKKKRKLRRELLRDSFDAIRWSWESDPHEMQPYTLDVSARIEACFQKGDDSCVIVRIGDFQYIIFPKKKIQVNKKTNKTRRIERNTLQDHKYTWQFEQENGLFEDYDEPDSTKIELHYLQRQENNIKIMLAHREYIIDTERMCQIDVLTQKERQVRRIQENYVQYKWFWKKEENGWSKWVAFDSDLTQKLEINYLSKKKPLLLLEIEGTQFEVDTVSLIKTRKDNGKYWKIKREPASNDRAVWVWYTHQGTIKAFPTFISNLIETKFLSDEAAPFDLEAVEMHGKKYEINIQSMEKINIETNSKRKIERHVIPNFYPSNLEYITQDERSKIFKFLTQSGHLPLEWDWNQNQAVSLFEVSDRERNLLLGEFHQTMEEDKYTVNSIRRVQNTLQINNFLLERMNIKYFSHGANDSDLLFYLPDKEDPEKLYSEQDCALKNRFSGNKEYGQGYYFSKSAKLCDAYAFENVGSTKTLVLFLVLLGNIANIENDNIEAPYKGKYSHKEHIKKPPKDADSISTSIQDHHVNILYNPERCYPLYFINYKKN